MRITISKKEGRSQLTCTRPDGTFVTADLGPKLPYHDLAHFVVERQLGLQRGFFGMIERGYSVSQLSEKKVIQTLGAESLIAEVAARALQSLLSGACSPTQFAELVNAELTQWSVPNLSLTPPMIEQMATEFQGLVCQYETLGNGRSLVLTFQVRPTAAVNPPADEQAASSYALVRDRS